MIHPPAQACYTMGVYGGNPIPLEITRRGMRKARGKGAFIFYASPPPPAQTDGRVRCATKKTSLRYVFFTASLVERIDIHEIDSHTSNDVIT